MLLALTIIIFDQPWLTALLAYGFVARVLTGPKLSPLGQLVTRSSRPRLPVAPKLVAGPPKRFAQGIGAVFSVTTAVLALGFGFEGAADVVLGLLVVTATPRVACSPTASGCHVFALLMRTGVIPAEVCERCNDIWATAS